MRSVINDLLSASTQCEKRISTYGVGVIVSVALAAGFTSGCMRELPRFGSMSPDHRCDITVDYAYRNRWRLHPQLSVYLRCDTDVRIVFKGDEDWAPRNAEFYWSKDSRLVTLVACNDLAAPTILTYDTVAWRIVDSRDQVDALRAKIRANFSGSAPSECGRDRDPLLWACCSVR